MSNEKHVERLLQGSADWNKWREENKEIRPDLSGANLIAHVMRNEGT